jgi:hypothetical protein
MAREMPRPRLLDRVRRSSSAFSSQRRRTHPLPSTRAPARRPLRSAPRPRQLLINVPLSLPQVERPCRLRLASVARTAVAMSVAPSAGRSRTLEAFQRAHLTIRTEQTRPPLQRPTVGRIATNGPSSSPAVRAGAACPMCRLGARGMTARRSRKQTEDRDANQTSATVRWMASNDRRRRASRST